jgi:conjugal transfer/entry exclusion protein
MNRLSIAIIILFLTSGLYAKTVIKKSELHSLLNEQQQIAKMFPNYYKESHKNNKQAIQKMKKFISRFGKNQNKLTGHEKNNKLIKQKLSSIAEQWEVSHNLSKKAKHDGIIKSMMTGIGKNIKELRKLYSKTY